MKKRLTLLFAVILLIGLALVGWLWSGNNSRPELPVKVSLPETPAKVELAEIALKTSLTSLGDLQTTQIEILNSDLKLSALSLSLSYEYNKQPPVELAESPFILDQGLADAGWQVLINRLVNDLDNKQLTLELALGKISGKDQPEQTTSGLLGELKLRTTGEIEDAQWRLNPTATRVIDDQGEVLPVKLISEPFSINQTAEPLNGEKQ